MRHPLPLCCALGAALVLAACSDTKYRTITTTGTGGADPAAVAAAEERADAAEMALDELRASLAAAQAALTPGTTAQQREQARDAVMAAREDLKVAREMLTDTIQPPGAARTAADAALAAVDTALARTAEALQAMGDTASAGPLQLATMHPSLDRAQAALDDAQARLGEALEANPSAALRNLLAQAQATLTTAQVSLVPLLREELAARAAERNAARAEREAQRQRADTYDPRVSLAAALLPREARFVPRGEVEITRTPRADSGEEGWEKLEIASDGVAWAAGKRIGAAAGGLSASDELPLRAVTLRAAGRHRMRIQGDDGTPDSYSNTDGVVTSSLQLSDAGVTVKFGGAGVIYYDNQRRFDIGANQDDWASTGPDGKRGDAGATAGATMNAAHATDLGLAAASGSLSAAQATTLVGYALDNPSRFGADRKQGDASAADGAAMTVAHAADLGLSEPSGNLDAAQAALLVGYAEDNPASVGCWQEDLSLCGDWNHDDLTIAFGAPSQSPHGEPAYYWKARVPLTAAQLTQRLPNRMQEDDANADGRPQELATYQLWLSHYGGLDRGADAEDAGDDRHRYLQYAAYGLFMVFDNVKATPSFSRPQAFAAGYDAFMNADGMRTTELATSIAASFKGHTMARELNNDMDTTHITLSGATPLRGDIALNACIGASACSADGIPTGANTIAGMISNLELLRHDGVWIPYRRASGEIEMMEGAIAADGSFGGQLEHPRLANGNLNSWDFDANIGPGSTHPSQYRGNLYGPRDSLEAAGWWYMQSDGRAQATLGGLIGSFGAVACQDGDSDC